jgi:hypothetical protein
VLKITPGALLKGIVDMSMVRGLLCYVQAQEVKTLTGYAMKIKRRFAWFPRYVVGPLGIESVWLKFFYTSYCMGRSGNWLTLNHYLRKPVKLFQDI